MKRKKGGGFFCERPLGQKKRKKETFVKGWRLGGGERKNGISASKLALPRDLVVNPGKEGKKEENEPPHREEICHLQQTGRAEEKGGEKEFPSKKYRTEKT